ncbi:MAG: DoxX family protein [Bacteroidia bacterium]|nr:DoxX family protein [Bacteroidia bacterium]MCF8426963.1 DoxX family protein [Bacteroidia bacterium]MCF8447598.1 DoxX family protein [Bacteroidia bacterium]
MKFNLETIVRLVVAGILLQTLYFKFSGAAESVYIFTQVGIEPWGRIGSGIAELIAAILILLPATIGLGAALALGVISGAILTHLTKLGIEVQGDGGTLFYLALAVFFGSLFLAWKHRKDIPIANLFFK